jgi:hypothetical protein
MPTDARVWSLALSSDSIFAGTSSGVWRIPVSIAQSIPLVTGWNLVSFPLHPASTAIEDVLSSLGSSYDLVYAWDATGGHAGAGNWMRYAPGIPGNTLATLDETQGFWIRMTGEDTLEITGTAPTTTNISLSINASGWNLVGYPSVVNRSMPDALSTHGVTDYSLVYAYHADDADTWKRYAPDVPGNDLSELAPGWGYWIKVSEASTLTYSFNEGGTLTLNDFANYRVFQRDIGGTSKSVTITGSYSNMNWSRIEARILRHSTSTVVLDWATIDSTFGGGTFSGSLTVPQGGWYNLEVRAVDASQAEIGLNRGTSKWGVGMIILAIGQSNMVGMGHPPVTVANSDLAVNYSNAGRWEHLADPYDDESPPGAVDNDNYDIAANNGGGSMMPALANALLQTFDFPIAFVPSAKSGSNLYTQWAYRNPSNHYDTSTLYGQSITKAQSVGGVELIIMHQGEADTNAHRTEAQYETDFASMIGHYRQDLYANIPIFFCQLGTITIIDDPRTDADVVAVRNAQHDLDNGLSNFMAATAMDQPRIDDVHYTVAGLNVIGQRVAQTIKFYFGAASYYRGPAISSAFFTDGNRNTVDIQISHRGGNDINPVSGITGFSLFSNGSPVSIISVSRMSADRIRLALASAIPAGNTVTLRYLWGSNPDISGLAKDNSSMVLPLENTTFDITVTDQ